MNENTIELCLAWLTVKLREKYRERFTGTIRLHMAKGIIQKIDYPKWENFKQGVNYPVDEKDNEINLSTSKEGVSNGRRNNR